MKIWTVQVWLGLGMVAGMGLLFGQSGLGQQAVWSTTKGKTILLWPAGAPGAKGDEELDRPSLTVYLPAGNTASNATSSAGGDRGLQGGGSAPVAGVVIAPGGGYQELSMQKEGEDIALWLNARGMAAFVLKYRLGPKYHHPVELDDAQRAIRLVRAHAAEYGVAVDHVGMWGFSAGGHLTATAGTRFDAGNAGATDTVERMGSRPDFLILAYPVITLEAPYTHAGSRQNLLGEDAAPALVAALSAQTQVTRETPPTFLFSTSDDKTVPVINSLLFYEALVKAGVPVEMHLFEHGGHGAGLALGNPQLSGWSELLIKWMRERGYAAPGNEALDSEGLPKTVAVN